MSAALTEAERLDLLEGALADVRQVEASETTGTVGVRRRNPYGPSPASSVARESARAEAERLARSDRLELVESTVAQIAHEMECRGLSGPLSNTEHLRLFAARYREDVAARAQAARIAMYERRAAEQAERERKDAARVWR